VFLKFPFKDKGGWKLISSGIDHTFGPINLRLLQATKENKRGLPRSAMNGTMRTELPKRLYQQGQWLKQYSLVQCEYGECATVRGWQANKVFMENSRLWLEMCQLTEFVSLVLFSSINEISCFLKERKCARKLDF